MYAERIELPRTMNAVLEYGPLDGHELREVAKGTHEVCLDVPRGKPSPVVYRVRLIADGYAVLRYVRSG